MADYLAKGLVETMNNLLDSHSTAISNLEIVTAIHVTAEMKKVAEDIVLYQEKHGVVFDGDYLRKLDMYLSDCKNSTEKMAEGLR